MSDKGPQAPDDDYPPLSALNDLLYCERRCALHRIEGVWIDNAQTLAGTLGHKRADKPVTWESADGVREVHGMWLKSDRLRLIGKADVVEFHSAGESLRDSHSTPELVEPWQEKPDLASWNDATTRSDIPYPVEYKRGKRRRWDNDDVQLCAQALCLEEMVGVEVPRGAIFHIKSKRRREVVFSDKLRKKTETAAARLHELIASGVTPPAVLKPQCDGCSLRAICLPELAGRGQEVGAYVRALFQE